MDSEREIGQYRYWIFSLSRLEISMSNPIQSGLFTWPSETPELLGARCLECGEYFFPEPKGCAACSSSALEVVPIGSTGTLWSWTIQGFMPKHPYKTDETPETFKPYGVGYIEMPCGLKVESRLRSGVDGKYEIGMKMDLVVEPFRGKGSDEELHFLFQAAV